MSIYKRQGSPYWQAEFQIDGRRIVRSTGEVSERRARQFERKIKAQLKAETKRNQGDLDVDAACGQYWIEHGSQRRDARDVARWLSYIVRHAGDVMMADLDESHVARLVTELRDAGTGQISINRTVVQLQGVHNRARQIWKLPVRAIHWKSFKTREASRETFLTLEQAKALLAHLPRETADLVAFLLLTGLRRSEAFGVAWSDVDIERQCVRVQVKGGIDRDVALSEAAAAIILRQPRTGALVFDTTGWRKRFDQAKAAAGVPHLRWHDLRHTAASWMGQSGASLDVIRRQLGHSSITVTQKYRHVVDGEVRAALEAMPQLHEPPTKDPRNGCGGGANNR